MITNHADQIAAAVDFYAPRQPANWLRLASLADRAACQSSPLFFLHQSIETGACVARHNGQKWQSAEQAVKTAYHYGHVYAAAADYVCSATCPLTSLAVTNQAGNELRSTLQTLRGRRLPVPSAGAVIDTLYELIPSTERNFYDDLYRLFERPYPSRRFLQKRRLLATSLAA